MLTKMWRNIPSYIKYATLVVLILAIILNISASYSRYHFDKALKIYDEADNIMNQQFSNFKIADSSKLNILNNQIQIVEQKKNHHKYLLRIFTSFYFAAINIFHLSAVIAGIFAFLIANIGWRNSSSTLKAIFLVLSAATAYFGIFPNIYKHKYHININKKSYIEYSNIQNKIYNYVTTGSLLKIQNTLDDSTYIKMDTIDINEFIKEINVDITSLNNVYFDLNEEKISIPDVTIKKTIN